MHNTEAKPVLSFSIANILKVEETAKGCLTSRDIPSKETETLTESGPLTSTIASHLPWLAYTRYCPPKIPSKFKF